MQEQDIDKKTNKKYVKPVSNCQLCLRRDDHRTHITIAKARDMEIIKVCSVCEKEIIDTMKKIHERNINAIQKLKDVIN